MEPNSRLSYTAGINSWISFCVMIEDITPRVIPVEDQLKVTEDLARQWLTLIPEFKTAASYVSHLKMACALAKESVSWHTPLVKAQVKSKLKKDGLEIPKVRWVCQKETLLQMVEHAESQGMEWLAVLLIVSYTFQWRVYSEYFKIAYVDIHFLNTPVAVACDEAVNLANKYSDIQGRKFINGVLRRLQTVKVQ